jgi:hypothetical protein
MTLEAKRIAYEALQGAGLMAKSEAEAVEHE